LFGASQNLPLPLLTMFTVYLLRSISNPDMTYVGYTAKSIHERLREHNDGLTITTAPHTPWEIEIFITFRNREKAEQFEKYLKHGSGYAFANKHFWTN